MDGLPAEILCRIVDEVEQLPCDDYECREAEREGYRCKHRLCNLNALCQTNKALHAAAMEQLYAVVDLEARSLRYFLKTAIVDQRLAAMVKEVTFSFLHYMEDSDRIPMNDAVELPDEMSIQFRNAAEQSGCQWGEEDLGTMDEGSADAEATLLLQYLPNVTKLNLDFPVYDPDDESNLDDDFAVGIFMHNILRRFLTEELVTFSKSEGEEPSHQHRPLAKLESIHLPMPFMEPWSIKSSWPHNVFWDLPWLNGLFLLNGLRHLSIARCTSGSHSNAAAGEPDMPAEVQKRYGKSELEELFIVEAGLGAAALDRILRLPRALKKFIYRIPTLEEMLDWGLFDPQYYAPGLLFQEGLLAQKHSLEYLQLVTLNCEGVDCLLDRVGDGDLNSFIHPVDLHEFTALKHIFLHITDLLGRQDSLSLSMASGRFLNVLPPGVEKMTLLDTEMRTRGEMVTTEGKPEVFYACVKGLLESKTSRFRNLKQLNLFVPELWSPAEDSLLMLAEAIGVDLKIEYLGKNWQSSPPWL